MSFLFVCDPCRIQTCNPHIRSVVLYSVELMDLFSKAGAKVLLFFDMCKFFGNFFQKKTFLPPPFVSLAPFYSFSQLRLQTYFRPRAGLEDAAVVVVTRMGDVGTFGTYAQVLVLPIDRTV